MLTILIVAILGALGALSRFLLDQVLPTHIQSFPLVTFGINIVGSFLAGLLYALAERNFLSPLWSLGLLVGFCGGFTTFSSYALQGFLMMEKGRIAPALTYMAMSPLLGLLAVMAAITLVRNLNF